MKKRAQRLVLGGLVLLLGLLLIFINRPVRPPLHDSARALMLRSAAVMGKLHQCVWANTNEIVTAQFAKQKGFLTDEDLAFINSAQCVFTPFTGNTPTNVVLLELPFIYEGQRRGQIIWKADFSGQMVWNNDGK
jgi:hypothetical protein